MQNHCWSLENFTMQRTKPAKKAHSSIQPDRSPRGGLTTMSRRIEIAITPRGRAREHAGCVRYPEEAALILFCPPCREYAKIFRRLARRVAVARDANLAVVRIAARNARSRREMLRHAASVPG